MMPSGPALHTGRPPLSHPMQLPSRCACLQRGSLPQVVHPVLKRLRGPEIRCSLAATATERPSSETAEGTGHSLDNGRADRADNHAQSNGSDESDVLRIRNSVVYNVVSQALADGQPALSAFQPAATLGEDLGSLRRELSGMRELLGQQAELVRQQSHAIKQLKGMVKVQTQQTVDAVKSRPAVRPLEAQLAALGDRRYLGMYDARFHSTNKGATPRDMRILPRKIILVRHAESEGNVSNLAYTFTPDPQVPLTERGWGQARAAGQRIKEVMEADGKPYRLYFYTSPYKRSHQTYQALAESFATSQVAGQQEEVQLREQDFGNFQDGEQKQREKAERLRFGRFFYRFPHGESGADVYDRMTIFEDHMIRDINAGRYNHGTSLVLVTHGLALRVFLMRWFHWTVDQFLEVFNPPNAEPLILERVPGEEAGQPDGEVSWMHTKALYRLTDDSKPILRGCTDEMCSSTVDPMSKSPDDPPY